MPNSSPTDRVRHIDLLATLQAELAPFPGRLSGSLRDALAVTIALVAAMTLRIPGISLALALLFLLQRERPGLTLRSALQIFGGALLACAAAFTWVQLTDGTEFARFFGIVLGIFIASFCMAATRIPVLFTIFGFYGFLDLSSWDAHRSPDAIVTSSLYNLASLALVLGSSVAVEYLFSTRHPADDLQREIKTRLTVLTRFLRAMAQSPAMRDEAALRSIRNTVIQYAHSGDARMNELYDRLHDSGADAKLLPVGTHFRIGLLSRLLEKAAAVGLQKNRTRADSSYYALLTEQCDRLQWGNASLSTECLPSEAPDLLHQFEAELRDYATSLETSHIAPASAAPRTQSARRRPPLFLPGAFQNAEAVTYALKLTLAATLCYILYNAIAWPGIVTCVVTVLFTGLSTTGAMKQKQLYRFSGAAIGGVLAIASISLLFPNMDSITSLVLVVGAVALLSGWVLRSPRMGYVGVQIGFAFFITTLPGFSAPTLIAPARDRVIGVAIGIAVMWVIFDQLWPTRTSTALKQILNRIREAKLQLRTLVQVVSDADKTSEQSELRAAVSLDLAQMHLLESAAYFDFGQSHGRELAESRRIIRQIEAAAGEFYSESLHPLNQAPVTGTE
ncbi:hypothetical protein BH10ACI4_BH10ACI4_06610 [soil metagenome]